MNRVFEAALEVDRFCRERGWPFFIIGGIAVQRWGEPRGTQDVDLTILTGFGDEERFVDDLLARFAPRGDDARTFALRRRVVLARSSNQTPIDAALGALPYEKRAIARASEYEIASGRSLLTCSAEDLVVLKVFAGRVLDWHDVKGVATRQADRIDQDLIFRELQPLLALKGTPEAMGQLREIFRQAQQ